MEYIGWDTHSNENLPYGEMFSVSEIHGAAGATAFDQTAADIEGRTGLERVLAEVCEWVEPGTGNAVFPDAGVSPLEDGFDFIANPILT